MEDPTQRAMTLADNIETESYYGFNIRCVFAEMARNHPDYFETVEWAFKRARLEREEIAARNAARKQGQG